MAMYILNTFSAIEKMTIKEINDFIYENYYSRMGFVRETVITQ